LEDRALKAESAKASETASDAGGSTAGSESQGYPSDVHSDATVDAEDFAWLPQRFKTTHSANSVEDTSNKTPSLGGGSSVTESTGTITPTGSVTPTMQPLKPYDLPLLDPSHEEEFDLGSKQAEKLPAQNEHTQSDGIVWITGTNPSDFKSKDSKTQIRKDAMSRYLQEDTNLNPSNQNQKRNSNPLAQRPESNRHSPDQTATSDAPLVQPTRGQLPLESNPSYYTRTGLGSSAQSGHRHRFNPPDSHFTSHARAPPLDNKQPPSRKSFKPINYGQPDKTKRNEVSQDSDSSDSSVSFQSRNQPPRQRSTPRIKQPISHTVSPVTRAGGGEIRLRVDATAPLSLQFNGDMEDRTIEINPVDGGMADIIIGPSRTSNENIMRKEQAEKAPWTSGVVAGSTTSRGSTHPYRTGLRKTRGGVGERRISLNASSDRSTLYGPPPANSEKTPAADPEIVDLNMEQARERKAMIEYRKEMRELEDRRMAEAIQKYEEQNQIRFEVERTESRAKERAEGMYLQVEKSRADGREKLRRQRREEDKEKAKKDAARVDTQNTERVDKGIEKKESGGKASEHSTGSPTRASSTQHSAGSSISQEQVSERDRIIAEMYAHIERERAAAEQREQISSKEKPKSMRRKNVKALSLRSYSTASAGTSIGSDTDNTDYTFSDAGSISSRHWGDPQMHRVKPQTTEMAAVEEEDSEEEDSEGNIKDTHRRTIPTVNVVSEGTLLSGIRGAQTQKTQKELTERREYLEMKLTRLEYGSISQLMQIRDELETLKTETQLHQIHLGTAVPTDRESLIGVNERGNNKALDITATETQEDASTPHLLPQRVNLSGDGWKIVRSKLPESWMWDVDYHKVQRSVRHNYGCWTCTPTEPDDPINFPLTISGAPVVLPIEYRWPPVGGVNPPPDPRPSDPIDCTAELSLDTIRDLFLTFEGSIGFYLLINGLLQIIVSEDFDTAWASSHLPHKYGGLRVSYIQQSMEPTMIPTKTETMKSKSSTSSQQSRLSSLFGQSRSDTSSLKQSLRLNDFIEARTKSRHKEKFSGRIGLKITRAKQPYLVMSTHIITEAILSKSHVASMFSRRERCERLHHDWNDQIEIWAGNEQVCEQQNLIVLRTN
jgi:hypothetical protein